MSKRVFQAGGVPTEPQISGSPDFNDETVVEANPFVMRGRMVAGVNTGIWSPVSLPEYQYGVNSEGEWTDSKVYNQLSTIGSDAVVSNRFYDDSENSYIKYVKEVTVNLDEVAGVNAPITGVDVWFRWMPADAFQAFNHVGYELSGLINGLSGYTTTAAFIDNSASYDDIPVAAWQKPGMSSTNQANQNATQYWEPPEWTFVGTRFANSFGVAIPMPSAYNEWEEQWNQLVSKPGDGFRQVYVNDNFPDVWFQILVTGHSTWKPDRFNYRWIGNSDQYLSADFDTGAWASYQQYWSEGASTGSINDYKVGEYFQDTIVRPVTSESVTKTFRTAGYLPWNPHYGNAQSDKWNTYRRQRTTFGDIAIFAPRRWRKVF